MSFNFDHLYSNIKSFLVSPDPENHQLNDSGTFSTIEIIGQQAFVQKNENALLYAHRILYSINMAHLAVSWKTPANNVMHPVITHIKYQLENGWEKSENLHYGELLITLPQVDNFTQWVKQYVNQHRSNELHPIFTFIRDRATFEQMREFLFQESPLEMLFSDILALMLPGVYGSIKTEFLKNYWDEVGHADEAQVHRHLREIIMKRLQIPTHCYLHSSDLLVREELELLNMYLSLAINRAKHTELVGAMLATELMIPNRFQYSIEGWRRFGLDDEAMTYFILHTSVDEVHSEDWLMHVVLPILTQRKETMPDIVRGILRRLDISVRVLDKLYARLQQMEICSLGPYQPERPNDR